MEFKIKLTEEQANLIVKAIGGLDSATTREIAKYSFIEDEDVKILDTAFYSLFSQLDDLLTKL
jgi:hypothetical protein